MIHTNSKQFAPIASARLSRFFLGAFLCLFIWAHALLAQTETARAQRIVSSSPNVTEILFAIGAGDEVVGVDDYSKYPPEAGKCKRIGGLGNINVETLIALEPTLMVIYGRNPDLEVFCKQRNIATGHVMVESVADLFKAIESLGKATGR